MGGVSIDDQVHWQRIPAHTCEVYLSYEQSGSQLRVPKAAELLAARIRGQIIRSELKEGDALPAESELMETFGVSRPTLREAIRVLEMESLLRMRR
jgi:DNA-binding GntR family transcriptional regulator